MDGRPADFTACGAATRSVRGAAGSGRIAGAGRRGRGSSATYPKLAGAKCSRGLVLHREFRIITPSPVGQPTDKCHREYNFRRMDFRASRVIAYGRE